MATFNFPDLRCSGSVQSSLSSLSVDCDDAIDWRERCQVLEASLLKFKQKAGRIRELLTEKWSQNSAVKELEGVVDSIFNCQMKEMELRVQEADQRAAEAEDRYRMLEMKRGDRTNRSTEVEGFRIKDLKSECAEKDLCISELRCQLEEQHQLRLQEAKLVEEKSSKIREWVTKKIQDMESCNALLLTENSSLREQLETQRYRGIESASCDHDPKSEIQDSTFVRSIGDRSSKRSSSMAMDLVCDQIPAEDLIPAENIHSSSTNSFSFSTDFNRNDNVCNRDDSEPDYQEVADSREAKYRLKVNCIPQVRIERKIFAAAHSLSLVSSSNGSRELLNSEIVDRGSNRSSFDAPTDGGTAGTSSNSQTPVMLTPKEPPSPLTPFLPNVPPNSPLPLGAFPIGHSSQMVSAVATMPRRKKDAQKFFPQMRERDGPQYGPMTIDRKFKKGFDTTRLRPKPPTPPMRRLPSWESRIYAVAVNGLQMPPQHTNASSMSEQRVSKSVNEEINAPVYAVIKGRAAQIRSSPFTGDSSSETSDADEQASCIPSFEKKQNAKIHASNGCRQNGITAGAVKLSTTTSAGAVKQSTTTSESKEMMITRVVSTHSIASDTSSDYALPPDDAVSVKTDSSEICEPEQKLTKYTRDAYKKNNQEEKMGYLSKLGGKVKCWQRRWFIMKSGELFYYRSPNDMNRKSGGHISLDANTKILWSNSRQTFEIVTSKRTYYFAADCSEDANEWMQVLQNVVHKYATEWTNRQNRVAKDETMCGWLIKTKNGRCRRCWCVLTGKTFVYYRNSDQQTPLGQINLRDARIEEVDRSCETDSDSDVASQTADYTLAIWPANDGPTYLLIPVKQKKDSWLYHLIVACGGGMGKVGTDYEQLIAKLMFVEGDPSSSQWKDHLLLYSKEQLSKPLTTLPSEDLQKKAVELSKLCHSFMTSPIDSSHFDIHVQLAQTILATCIQHTELQSELFCQLIKQTSRHPPQMKSGVQNFLLCGSHSWFQCDSSPTSPTNSLMDLSDSKLNPSNYVTVQGWQLLTMAISLFVPKQSILWYLRMHLQRNADSRTEAGKFAVFCQCALERTLQNGPRERRPSRMEILSILSHNPYHHSQPISIPVHFVNCSYQVISFDGSTTVQEFLLTLNKAINMRDCALSGFSLFVNNPSDLDEETSCLKTHLKLCDVISKWEQTFLQLSTEKGFTGAISTIKLSYKNRLYFKNMCRLETEKERLLLACQINDEIVAGRFPASPELSLELAALMAQIEYGDMKSTSDVSPSSLVLASSPQHSSQQMLLAQAVDRFLPRSYRSSELDGIRSVEQSLAEKWSDLRGKSTLDCVRVYLSVTRKWSFFGSKLISSKLKRFAASTDDVWLAVHEDGIALLDFRSLKPLNSYSYGCIVTFGGYKDDFMLVIDGKKLQTSASHAVRSQRLLLTMSKSKVLETTLLMASYINSRNNLAPLSNRQATSSSNHATKTVCIARSTDTSSQSVVNH